jgi:NAD-reducing hydrogenase large subunit
MTHTILLQKATRIEGNAQIHVEIEGGRVRSARFAVQDFRGFEKLTQGKAAESVPHLVSRICGLCSCSHQVASLRAIEHALRVETPPAVERLRRAALLGEWIASHAVSFFFLTLPDAAGLSRGVFDLMQENPEVAVEAFALRRAGTRIVQLIGKREVHPVSLGVGRMLIVPTPEELAEASRLAAETASRALDLVERLGRRELPRTPIPFPAGHAVKTMIHDDRHGQDVFRVFDADGCALLEFARDAFEDHVAEMRVDWSLAKVPYLSRFGFPEGIVLVGPLARLNRADGVLQLPELAGLRLAERLRDPRARRLDSFDACRLLEIVWAARQIETLIRDVPAPVPGDAAAADLARSGTGIGVVEAPRGLLAHTYVINRGLIERLRLLVATQINNAFINLTLRDVAERHAVGDGLSKEGEDMVARCVRTFDPCLTCATH